MQFRLQTRLRAIAVAGLIGLACGATATAQHPPGWGRGFGRPSLLIEIPEVQVELNIADAQKALLDALEADLLDQRRGLLEEDAPLPGDPRGQIEWLEQTRARLEEFNRRSEQLVSIILEPEQSNRLDELRLQREGAGAFNRSEVLDKLQLTEEQRNQVADILKRSSTPRSQVFLRFQLTSEELAEQEQRILAVMTDTQQARWKELQGKAFQFPQRAHFGRQPNRP